MNLDQELSQPDRYSATAFSLCQKLRSTRKTVQSLIGDLPVDLVESHIDRISEAVARDVSQGRYAFKPATIRWVHLDKDRRLHRFEWLDRVVSGAIVSALNDLLDPHLSPRVRSYRPGHSQWTTLQELGRYLAQYRSKTPVHQRELFVLKRDVRGYLEEVPTHTESPLWPMIQQVLGKTNQHWMPWIAQIITPQIVEEQSIALRLEGRGVPVGSPIGPWIANLYLSLIDRELEKLPDSFYVRFGDDLLLVTPHREDRDRAAKVLDQEINRLELAFNPSKNVDLTWKASGYQGSAWIEHLGLRIHMSGKRSLKIKKHKDLIDELDRRLTAAARSLPVSERERIQTLVALTNRAFDPHSGFSLPHASLLRNQVDDPGYLLGLDLTVCRMILKHAVGQSSVRALRDWSPQRLKSEFGLRWKESRSVDVAL